MYAVRDEMAAMGTVSLKRPFHWCVPVDDGNVGLGGMRLDLRNHLVESGRVANGCNAGASVGIDRCRLDPNNAVNVGRAERCEDSFHVVHEIRMMAIRGGGVIH